MKLIKSYIFFVFDLRDKQERIIGRLLFVQQIALLLEPSLLLLDALVRALHFGLVQMVVFLVVAEVQADGLLD